MSHHISLLIKQAEIASVVVVLQNLSLSNYQYISALRTCGRQRDRSVQTSRVEQKVVHEAALKWDQFIKIGYTNEVSTISGTVSVLAPEIWASSNSDIT